MPVDGDGDWTWRVGCYAAVGGGGGDVEPVAMRPAAVDLDRRFEMMGIQGVRQRLVTATSVVWTVRGVRSCRLTQ